MIKIELVEELNYAVFTIPEKISETKKPVKVTIKLSPQVYSYENEERVYVSGAFKSGKFTEDEIERLYKILHKKFNNITQKDVDEATWAWATLSDKD